MEQRVFSGLGDDGFLELLLVEFWHLWDWSTGPGGDDRENKAVRKIWSKFQEQLGGFAVMLSEFSSWEKPQYRSCSSPPAGSCVQALSCWSFLLPCSDSAVTYLEENWGFVSALKDLQTFREQITSEEQGKNLKREGGTEAPVFWTLQSFLAG